MPRIRSPGCRPTIGMERTMVPGVAVLKRIRVLASVTAKAFADGRRHRR
jgi:hypothetical protein